MKKFLVLFMGTALVLRIFAAGGTAGNATPGATPLWTADGNAKNKVVVVSDLHFGIDDRYSEDVKNRSVFIEFLTRLENTADVGELVIAGDFLDEWYLPLTYSAYEDSGKFYRLVIKNNQIVFDELNALMKKGVKLTYVPGNHDMLLESGILQEALPGLNQARDARGLGTYVTGARDEIAIEHGHRYDVFSAPDSVSNKEITGDAASILPPGYFYARVAASWVLQGKPLIKKDYPEIDVAPDPRTNPDQYGAYIYYKIWSGEMNRITPFERFEDHVIDIKLNGYNGKYSIKDFYPVVQGDGSISAPVLFKNYQRGWDKNQDINLVKVKTSFIEAVAGTLSGDYFFDQARKQYLENPSQRVDVVVFGHTHRPALKELPNSQGKYYANSGSWIDENTYHPQASTFVVVTSRDSADTAEVYEYYRDGTVKPLK
jgi:UDP-2,3-diacylglucosamine pyrophosphatase LpxH